MSTQAKTRSKNGKRGRTAASIVWFEIAADNVERAKSFYGALFGWKIEELAGPMEFWHIDTGSGDATRDGEMMRRRAPEHGITNYVGVPSVDEFESKVQTLGGKICVPKTAVPQMGYFAVCQDTENNMFGLWEKDRNAKKIS